MLARLAALVALSGVLAASYAHDWELFDDYQGQHGMHVPAQEHGHFDYYEPQPHEDWHHPELSHFDQQAPVDEERPHFPHPKKPVEVAKTIYEFLEAEPNFSRLFKIVNFSSEVTSLLNDSSTSVTFFALPNSAFPKRPKGKKPEKRSESIMDMYNPLGWQMQSLATAEVLVENVDNFMERVAEMLPGKGDHRKDFEKGVTAILLYHTLPEQLSPVQLSLNSTFATSLTNVSGALDGEAQRIRVGKTPLPIGLSINLYSRITHGLFTTTNGAIYTISKPLVPFPPAFDSAFLLQKHFSIFTSALQHSGVDELLKFSFRHSENSSAVTTVFAPTNAAFERLPLRLSLFLFSPFGKHVLTKLMQYHVVPNMTVHTDWILNKTSEAFTIEYGTYEDDDSEFVAENEESDDFDFDADVYEYEQEDYGSEMFGPRWMEHHRPSHRRGPRHARNTRSPVPCGPHPGQRAHSCSSGPFPNMHRVGCFGGPPPRGPGRACASHRCGWPGMPPPHSFEHPHRLDWCPRARRAQHRPPRREWHHQPRPDFCPHAPPSWHAHARPDQRPHPQSAPDWLPHARPKFPHPRLTQNITLELPTAVTNHSLTVELLKTEFKLPHLPPRFNSVVIVNGHPVKVSDVTALNGAIHVVDRLIVPRRPGHPKGSPGKRSFEPALEFVDEEWNMWAGEENDDWVDEDSEWEDWEDWLIQWAVEVDHPEVRMDDE